MDETQRPKDPDPPAPRTEMEALIAIQETQSAMVGELIVMNARLLNVLDELMRPRR